MTTIRQSSKQGFVFGGVVLSAMLYFSIIAFLFVLSFDQPQLNRTFILAATITSLCLAGVFRQLRKWLEKLAERVIYKEKYIDRQLALGSSAGTDSLRDIEKLADGMLQPLIRAVGATGATLLVGAGEYFIPVFSATGDGSEHHVSLKLKKAGRLIELLERTGSLVTLRDFDDDPELKAECAARTGTRRNQILNCYAP